MTNAEINAFIVICQEKSISKAAEKLYISQSSLSTKIKTLEKELEYELFVRGRGQRSIMLTDEGKEFYKLALRHKEITDSMMAIGRKKEFSSLSISTLSSMGTYLFAPVYDLFMENYPNITLKIQDKETYTAYASMSKGHTDLAFTVAKLEYPGISSYPLFAESMDFVCSRQADLPETVNFKDLDVGNEVYVPWTETFMAWHDIAFGNYENAQIKVELMSQLKHFLARGESWAIVPSSVANHMVRDNNIVRKNLGFDVPKRMVIYAYADDKSKLDLINAFLNYVKEVLSKREDYEIEIFN